METREILDVLMFVTVCGFLLAGFPVAFTLAGTGLIFAGIGWLFGVFDFSLFGALPSRIFGNSMTNEVLIAVPLFVFMGVMLERSKVAEELLDAMGMLFGSLRGGLGISVSIVGALLAASTGIVGATVVTMGLLSLPTMLRRGYDPALACGSICASGTLGQIIPPSIVLVLLGDQISNAYVDAQRAIGNWSPEPVSVGDLFAGALLPGLALVGMYITYQAFTAWLRPATSPAIPKEELAVDGLGWRIAHALIPPVVLIIAVLGSILAGIATPTEAASVGAVGSLFLAGLRQDETRGLPIHAAALGLVGLLIVSNNMDLRVARNEISLGDMAGIALAGLCLLLMAWGGVVSLSRTYKSGILAEVGRGTMLISSMVFVILIGASVFSLVFRGLGGDDLVHEVLSQIPGGKFGAILVVMLVMFVLGFFLDFIEITFVVVPIVAPVLLMMDVNPVWLGVMMAMNLQTSFLTPPFGFALFYLRGVAPAEVTTMHIYRGVMPFVLIQVLALALLASFPQLATWLPKVVFG
ncbi:TRAP transporter large permease subunit [Magnetospira sp. QH-2]|uniref:TRAP transporter large permease n=1 Tax=Magnetospira sp. (strain QH-2) TaxID=1288970 RepID=UPI0003E80F1E|nr:TRAP transporter large permease subunit [Magnetospira sp. QH-2]CCQ73860.1 TRAP dicarboxylate transporter, DctM subunit [Magnetospira sp. QH-2]